MSKEPVPFKREDRYVVIKRSDLDKLSPLDRDIVQSNLEHISAILFGWNVPERECLVIESDWPEYAPAWAAIEARVTGQPAAKSQFDQEQALRAFEARAMPGDGSYRVRDGVAAVVRLCSDRRAAVQHQGQPILIQAVAVTRQNDEGMYLEWLLEGGICEMEFPGQVLFAMPEANDLCDEDGSAEVYIRPAEQQQATLAVKCYEKGPVTGHSDVEVALPNVTHYDHGPNLAEALARLACRVARFYKLEAPTLAAPAEQPAPVAVVDDQPVNSFTGFKIVKDDHLPSDMMVVGDKAFKLLTSGNALI
ncbi:hypothetical protein ACIPI6_31660 [Pseudomonas protegens]|uniref:hypothetical protein n=1 Tax=Pseudomonas protegens TaxID=380021 RepID=UPI00380DB671